MSETLEEKIAELFKVARKEGAIRKWADGKVDADEVLSLITESAPKELEDCLLSDAEKFEAIKSSTGSSLYEMVRSAGQTQLHSPKLLAYIQSREEAARKEIYEVMSDLGRQLQALKSGVKP